jgi:hypothetical protein
MDGGLTQPGSQMAVSHVEGNLVDRLLALEKRVKQLEENFSGVLFRISGSNLEYWNGSSWVQLN